MKEDDNKFNLRYKTKEKMKTSKQTYVKPTCATYYAENENLLLASGNAGTIGVGGSGGDAKRGFYDEEEDETLHATFAHGVASVSSWEERTNK